MAEEMKRKQDYLVRGTAWDGKLRVFAVQTTELVDELRSGTTPCHDDGGIGTDGHGGRHNGSDVEGRGEADDSGER